MLHNTFTMFNGLSNLIFLVSIFRNKKLLKLAINKVYLAQNYYNNTVLIFRSK